MEADVNTALLTTNEALAIAECRLANLERRLAAVACRRDMARWAIARILPAAPDCFWHELEEAEYQYREARKARDEYLARTNTTDPRYWRP